jgi:hypothetical protein
MFIRAEKSIQIVDEKDLVVQFRYSGDVFGPASDLFRSFDIVGRSLDDPKQRRRADKPDPSACAMMS